MKQTLLDSGYNLYKDGMLFYPGCKVIVPAPFKAGKIELPAGEYKSRTIKSNGVLLLENNNGEEFISNIKYLVDAGFKLAE